MPALDKISLAVMYSVPLLRHCGKTDTLVALHLEYNSINIINIEGYIL